VFVALNRDELPVRARSVGSWLRGCAVPRTTQCWARRWWSCTPRATPPSRPLGRGRSPAAPTVPAAPTDPSNSRSGGWLPMAADPVHPDQLAGERRFRADLWPTWTACRSVSWRSCLGSCQPPGAAGAGCADRGAERAAARHLQAAAACRPSRPGPGGGAAGCGRWWPTAAPPAPAGTPADHPQGWPSGWPAAGGRPTCTPSAPERVRLASGAQRRR